MFLPALSPQLASLSPCPSRPPPLPIQAALELGGVQSRSRPMQGLLGVFILGSGLWAWASSWGRALAHRLFSPQIIPASVGNCSYILVDCLSLLPRKFYFPAFRNVLLALPVRHLAPDFLSLGYGLRRRVPIPFTSFGRVLSRIHTSWALGFSLPSVWWIDGLQSRLSAFSDIGWKPLLPLLARALLSEDRFSLAAPTVPPCLGGTVSVASFRLYRLGVFLREQKFIPAGMCLLITPPPLRAMSL